MNNLKKIISHKDIVITISSGIGIAILIFIISLIIEINSFKFFPEIPTLLEKIGYSTIWIQVFLWMALIPGNAFVFFMVYFKRIFGEGDIPIVKEINNDADIIAQNARANRKQAIKNYKTRRIILFNLTFATLAIILLINTLIFL